MTDPKATAGDEAAGPLAGFRVVDLCGGLAAGYCTKLYADAGADVIVVEAESGDPLRGWSVGSGDLGDADGALFRYLRHGQRSVPGADADALIATADVVVVGRAAESAYPVDVDDVTARHPGLVVLSITPYGRSGPYAERPATEFTVQAEAGSVGMRGRAATEPFQMGGRVGEWLSGAYGALASLLTVVGARETGTGGVVDLSMAETITTGATLFTDLLDHLRGRPEPVAPARSLETPSIEPTADGYVGFNTNTRQQFDDFCVMIDRAELAVEGTYASVGARTRAWDEWNALVHAWTTQHPTAEIIEQAAALRIPVTPVGNGRTITEVEHFRERGTFISDPLGAFTMPRRPWRIDGEPQPTPAPAPGLHQHAGAVGERAPFAGTGSAGGGVGALPLAGLTVIDATCWWAGPTAGQMLAAFGADVIHVESITRLDGMRMGGGFFFGEAQWWERAWFFLSFNVNKRGLTLDLASDAGRAAYLRLVEQADVVLENYTPRVMEQFDLDWPTVHATNPATILTRMPAFGLDGPWRDWPGFAQTMEQLSGLAWLTGHADDQPRIQRGPCDPNAGVHATMAVLAALERRRSTGLGSLVEVPMVEASLNIAAEQVIEWSAYGTLMERDGNRSPYAAPQNLYRAAAPEGEEGWVAVAVETDEQWTALAGLVDRADWLADAGLADLAGRRSRHDELDAVIGAWVSERSADDAVEALCNAGVPAGVMQDPRTISEHPQHRYRGFHEIIDHELLGPLPVMGMPFRSSGVERWVHRPAPMVGEHNEEILVGLGFSAAEISALEADGVIGTTPTGLG